MPGIYLTNAAGFIKVTGCCESEVRQPFFRAWWENRLVLCQDVAKGLPYS